MTWAAALGLGSALVAAFVPAWFGRGPAAVTLGVLGLVSIVLGSAWKIRDELRREGLCLVIYAPVGEEWSTVGPRWLARTERFSSHLARSTATVTRELPPDPSQWNSGVRDLRVLTNHHLREEARRSASAGRLNVLLSVPWSVAWSLGSDVKYEITFDLYQPPVQEDHAEREPFFRSIRWVSALRGTFPPPPEGDVIDSLRDHLTGFNPAVILDLGRDTTIRPDALRDAKARGVGEYLVIALEGRFEREVPASREVYETLLRRVATEAGAFLREVGMKGVESDPPASPRTLVYASLPVSVAFALGAALGHHRFTFMHWVNSSRTYEEAGVS